jgi:hypothetical protein
MTRVETQCERMAASSVLRDNHLRLAYVLSATPSASAATSQQDSARSVFQQADGRRPVLRVPGTGARMDFRDAVAV